MIKDRDWYSQLRDYRSTGLGDYGSPLRDYGSARVSVNLPIRLRCFQTSGPG